MTKTAAVIVAGGQGKRMGGSIKKQYIRLEGKEILAYTIEVFNKCTFINEIIVVVSEDEIEKVRENIINKYRFEKVTKVVAGGKERQDSVYNGLAVVSDEIEYVMIHDGARPFIKEETLKAVLEETIRKEAAVAAVPVKDTIKMVNKENRQVEATPKRELLWMIQTPQSFRKELLIAAYNYAKEKGVEVTDDSMLVEAYGYPVYIVEGDYRNIKITTPEDIIIGEAFLK